MSIFFRKKTLSELSKKNNNDNYCNDLICRSYSVESSFLPHNFVPMIKPKKNAKRIIPLDRFIIQERQRCISEDEDEVKKSKRLFCDIDRKRSNSVKNLFINNKTEMILFKKNKHIASSIFKKLSSKNKN